MTTVSPLRKLIETLRSIEIDPALDDDINRALDKHPDIDWYLTNKFFDVVKYARMSLFITPHALDEERVQLMLLCGFDIKLLPKYEMMLICRKGYFKIKRH